MLCLLWACEIDLMMMMMTMSCVNVLHADWHDNMT